MEKFYIGLSFDSPEVVGGQSLVAAFVIEAPSEDDAHSYVSDYLYGRFKDMFGPQTKDMNYWVMVVDKESLEENGITNPLELKLISRPGSSYLKMAVRVIGGYE